MYSTFTDADYDGYEDAWDDPYFDDIEDDFDDDDDEYDVLDDILDDEDDYDASATDEFPYLRSVLAEEYAALPNEALEDVFYGVVEGVDIDDYESFLKNLSKFGKSAGRVLGQAAPGAISGALQGATAGAALGPYGALAGGILGAVGGGVQSYAAAQQPQPAAAAPTAAPGTVAAPAAGVAARPGVPAQPVAAPPQAVAAPPVGRPVAAPPATQSQAAAQLMAILQRPETMQAILTVIMGQLGRRTVPVESVEVPATDVLHAVATLASRAAAGHAHVDAGSPEALPGVADELLLDDAGFGAPHGDATTNEVLALLDAAPIDSAWPVADDLDDYDDQLADHESLEDDFDEDSFDDDDYDDADVFEDGRLLLN